MSKWAKPISILSLMATIVPPLLFALKLMNEDVMKSIMVPAAIAWFIAAPFWLKEV